MNLLKMYRRRRPQSRVGDLHMYDNDTVRIDRQPSRLGGKWIVYAKDETGVFKEIARSNSYDDMIKVARKA